jgi:hypothetical protein
MPCRDRDENPPGKKNSLRISGSQHNLFGIVRGTVLATVMSPRCRSSVRGAATRASPGTWASGNPLITQHRRTGSVYVIESSSSNRFRRRHFRMPSCSSWCAPTTQRRLAGVQGVKVILERRQADRRRAKRPAGDERRHQERRIRQGKIFALGYIVVRFKRNPPPGRGIDRAPCGAPQWRPLQETSDAGRAVSLRRPAPPCLLR